MESSGSTIMVGKFNDCIDIPIDDWLTIVSISIDQSYLYSNVKFV